jgi:undecaprenyl-diphosphatase
MYLLASPGADRCRRQEKILTGTDLTRSMDADAVVALLAGLVQGVLEWLPVSSEGGVALVLAAVGAEPAAAVRFALVLHAGTALAALAYYRDDARDGVAGALAGDVSATGRFVVVATLVSGVVGIVAYAALGELLAALVGAERVGDAALALVGVALVATGLLQRAAGWGADSPHTDGGPGVSASAPDPDGGADAPAGGTGGAAGPGRGREPGLPDALLVGGLQGLAVLPGISRSGMTAGTLLLRGYDGPDAFRLSFLLAIPASFGAAGLAMADGGVPALAPAALLALSISAVVGYLTMDALLRVARRLPFWAVCVGLGSLAAVSGLLVV